MLFVTGQILESNGALNAQSPPTASLKETSILFVVILFISVFYFYFVLLKILTCHIN